MRGKAGRAIGNLVALLTVVKGLPLSYNRDLQEDKEPLFDTADTLEMLLPVATKMVRELKFNLERLREAADDPYASATDLADLLVLKGVPFREAHRQAGAAVAYALKRKKALAALTPEELGRFCPQAPAGVFAKLTLEARLAARSTFGGPAPRSVARQIRTARQRLARGMKKRGGTG
jgi:argininosuccinate lyase